MSKSSKPLDYQPSSGRPRATGLFIGWLILGAILTPAIGTGCVLLVASLSGHLGGFLAAAASIAVVIGLIGAIVRATEAGPRRNAVVAGLFTGVGVGVLLVGACFVYVARNI